MKKYFISFAARTISGKSYFGNVELSYDSIVCYDDIVHITKLISTARNDLFDITIINWKEFE